MHIKITQFMKGVLFSLLGYFFMAVMSICAKKLPHLPITTLVFAQFFIGFLFNLPSVLKSGMASVKTRHPWLMIIRATTGMLSLAAMVFAIRYIPVVDAVLLQNTIPLFVPLVLLLWLKKAIPHRLWLGLIIGFLGVLMIIKPNASIIDFSALVGLSAGILSAVSMVTISLLRKTEPTQRITFYFLLVGTVVTLPFMFLHWTPLQGYDVLWLFALGVSLYLGQLLVTHAFLFAPAHAIAPLSYSAVIFTGLLSWLIWGHVPDWLTVGGIIMVVVGGVMVILMEQRLQQRTKLAQESAMLKVR